MRRRQFSRFVPEETPRRALCPDYDQLFKASELPEPPSITYVPFDGNLSLADSVAGSVELSTLRETLVSSTKRDVRVHFSPYQQQYPELVPPAPYPPPPDRPMLSVQPEPQLPRPPELSDFLPLRSRIEEKIPVLYFIRCMMARPFADAKLTSAVDVHNKAYQGAEKELHQIQSTNAAARKQWEAYDSARKKWETLNEQCRALNEQKSAAWRRGLEEFKNAETLDIARLEQLRNV